MGVLVWGLEGGKKQTLTPILWGEEEKRKTKDSTKAGTYWRPGEETKGMLEAGPEEIHPAGTKEVKERTLNYSRAKEKYKIL